MYEAFYGLSEKPFSLTPSPRFVFQSEQYRAAEEALTYGIAQKEGFMLVTGAPGTGKTTLCRDLLEKLDAQKHRIALLFNPFLNGVEMLQALLSEFGVTEVSTTSRKELLDRLNTYLLEQLAAGRTCVAIFDEAQHLTTEFLEQIRVLSNLETEREKLIQVILVGQPELLALVRTPQMAQLDQRVSVRCTLTDLSAEETQRYVYHRLNVAGAKGRIKFSDAAMRLVHQASGGVPRLINLTCDRALLAGYAEQSRSIGEKHVRQAIASLRGEDELGDATVAPKTLAAPARNRVWWIVGAAAAALLVIGAVLWRVDVSADWLAMRAAATSSSSQAEGAYVRIAQTHRGSRQRPAALLRLAQLQIARGAPAEALAWLDTLAHDYPDDALQQERRYWTIRALLAGGDTARACAAEHDAGTVAPDHARDLSNVARECVAFADRVRADSASMNADSASAKTSVQPAGVPSAADSVR
jgi:general secretion pathway protein A